MEQRIDERKAFVEDMTEEEYRADPAVNKSTLWEMRKSPAHYKWALEHQTDDSPALLMGRVVHMAVLQPDEFLKHYVAMPEGIDRRTKAGKEAYQRYLDTMPKGIEVIDRDTWETAVAMMKSVTSCHEAFKLLDQAHTELPIFWTDESTGIECKAKIDALREVGDAVFVTDLKTCSNASTQAFVRDALRYGYDVQAAHYMRGVRALFPGKNVVWYFVAVEKKPPYAVNVIKAGDDFIDRGTWQLISLMDRVKECRETDTWPGYGENDLTLPEWAAMPDDDE